MNLLIVDDETPARERLVRLLKDQPQYNVAGEAANGIEAIEFFNHTPIDIVLLDIRMPLMDGMETAQHLMAHENPPAVIFTTAYSDHTIDAFATHAVDYLLKPIRQERLLEALASAQKTTRAQQHSSLKTLTHADGASARSHICVRKRGNLELIPVTDIYYFFAEHKYVTIVHNNGQSLIEESLIQLEEEFSDRFLRTHRNALVAINQINGLEKLADNTHLLTLRDCDARIDVSRRLLPNIRRMIKGESP